MGHRFSAVLRLCAVAMLVLAVSPTTAPFSTADPAADFGGGFSQGELLVQAKKAPDEQAAACGPPPARLVTLNVAADYPHVLPAGRVRGRDTHHLPLRI